MRWTCTAAKASASARATIWAARYQQVPIGITVEGANILTRCMIIFGQGAIRCHPYVLKEIAATAYERCERRLRCDFDRALWGHVSFVVTNAARALWLALTSARSSRFRVRPKRAATSGI